MNKKFVLFNLIFLFFYFFSLKLNANNNETFRWAGDSASGVPGIFHSLDNFELQGYEKEIAEAIAAKLGKTPVYVQNEWDGLIPGLDRDLYDAVINVIVITPEAEQEVNFSKPYYVTYQQLAVHVTDTANTLEDLNGRSIATLRNSYAWQFLKNNKDIDLRLYVEDTNLFKDLANKRVDGLLLDAPIVKYYGEADPKIKLVGPPYGRMEYGVAVRKGNQVLLNEINNALDSLIADGTLRQILERWALWNPLVAKTFNDSSQKNYAHPAYDEYMKSYASISEYKTDIKKYLSFLPMLGKGALMTVEISILSMLLAIGLGFLLAIARIYGPKPLGALAKIYIETIRGTPLLIQLYFIFYGLPNIGIDLNPFLAGTIALALNYAAYEAENYRAGILAVPTGQMEAARALGMTHWQGLRHVVMPQAFRIILPPMTNDFISLLKDSSLVSVITIVDLTFVYNMLATTYFNYFGIGILVALIYLLLGLPFVQLARWTERRFALEKIRRK
ncbi:amino acid ABC transporter permease [Opitutia bacterium SCGC AG-212-L18]|nr:amino acid ABC transporter permease [Opitutae bacterium SCGC AG-212-L18]